MITITPKAYETIKNSGSHQLMIDLVPKGCAGQQFTFSLEPPENFCSASLYPDFVLYTSTASFPFVEGGTLDCTSSDGINYQFQFTSKYQKDACGCGESVQLWRSILVK